jgi:hypothetical protein
MIDATWFMDYVRTHPKLRMHPSKWYRKSEVKLLLQMGAGQMGKKDEEKKKGDGNNSKGDDDEAKSQGMRLYWKDSAEAYLQLADIREIRRGLCTDALRKAVRNDRSSRCFAIITGELELSFEGAAPAAADIWITELNHISLQAKRDEAASQGCAKCMCCARIPDTLINDQYATFAPSTATTAAASKQPETKVSVTVA